LLISSPGPPGDGGLGAIPSQDFIEFRDSAVSDVSISTSISSAARSA
jgi:hypothetical protein